VTAFDGTRESRSSNEVRLYSGAPRSAPKVLAPAPRPVCPSAPGSNGPCWKRRQATRWKSEGAIPTADAAACTVIDRCSYQPGGDVWNGQLHT
jgi:hypothetical protein